MLQKAHSKVSNLPQKTLALTIDYLSANDCKSTRNGFYDGHAEGFSQTGVQKNVALNQELIPNITMAYFTKHLKLNNIFPIDR